VEARAEEVNDERIVLHLDRASDPGAAIAAVLPPRTLAMHLVAEDQGPLTGDEAAAPPGVSVRRGFGDQPPVFAAPDERSLAPVIARADGLEGRVAAIECQEGEYAEDPPCAAYLLEAPAGITNADVETALVSEDFANGFPTVRVELTSAGATRFAHLTGRGVRRKLAIVLDGEIVSAPVIQERIAGGVAQISLGEGSYQAQLEEAHGMAASLSTEPLSSTWVLAEER
jgi:preprotein translocase subunit SecD